MTQPMGLVVAGAALGLLTGATAGWTLGQVVEADDFDPDTTYAVPQPETFDLQPWLLSLAGPDREARVFEPGAQTLSELLLGQRGTRGSWREPYGGCDEAGQYLLTVGWLDCAMHDRLPG